MTDPPPPPKPMSQLLRLAGRVALKAGVTMAESGVDSVLEDAEDLIDTGSRAVKAIRDGIRARRRPR